jgi:hypothetical protein
MLLRSLRVAMVNDERFMVLIDVVFILGVMLLPNDSGERPPPAGTVERTRHSRTAARRRAEKRGGGSLDRFCWATLSDRNQGNSTTL